GSDEPRQHTLNDLALGQEHESLGLIRALDDLRSQVLSALWIGALDSWRQRTVSARKDTSRTKLQAAGCRRHDSGCQRDGRWHGATNPAYLPERGASCP